MIYNILDYRPLVSLLFKKFSARFSGGTGLERHSGRNGFKTRISIVDVNQRELASFLYGGQRGRFYIELKGGICKLLDVHDWIQIYALARRYDARINRIDFAADDWEGKYFDQRQILRDYAINPRAINPSVVRAGSYVPPRTVIDSPQGFTVEFGTKTSSHYHVIYQKFRESQGTDLAIKNPRWMRWEVRFYRQSKMELDLAMIIPDNWHLAWLGSSAYLEEMFKAVGESFSHRVQKIEQTAFENAVNLLLTLKKQYGVPLAHLKRILGSEGLLDLLCVDSEYPLQALTVYDSKELISRFHAAQEGLNAPHGLCAACPADIVDW